MRDRWLSWTRQPWRRFCQKLPATRRLPRLSILSSNCIVLYGRRPLLYRPSYWFGRITVVYRTDHYPLSSRGNEPVCLLCCALLARFNIKSPADENAGSENEGPRERDCINDRTPNEQPSRFQSGPVFSHSDYLIHHFSVLHFASPLNRARCRTKWNFDLCRIPADNGT